MKLNTDRIRLEIRRTRGPFLVYVALVVAGLAATAAILRNQTFLRPWEDHVEIRAAVSDAKGLVAGKQEVRVSGVKVGVVSDVELTGGRPLVTLSLDEEHAPVYRDARLRLRPVTPLQDMYVDLDRGSAKAGTAGGDFVIPEDHTVSPVDISRVLQTFDGDTRNRLTTLLRQMGPALADNGTQLRAAFVQAAPFLHAARQVSQAMADRRTELERLVTNFGGLTATLAEHDGRLQRLVTNGQRTLGELARRDEPLARTLAALPGTLSALDGAMTRLASARSELDPALDALGPVTRELIPGLSSLRRLGREAQPAFEALGAPVARLRPLARELRPSADSLAQAFVALERQAPAFDRLTAQLLPCRDVVRDFFANTPSVGKFANAYSSYPRGDISFDVGSVGGLSANGLTKSASCTDANRKGR